MAIGTGSGVEKENGCGDISNMPRQCTICGHIKSEEIDAALATAKALAEKKKAQYEGKSLEDRVWAAVRWWRKTSDMVDVLTHKGREQDIRAYLDLWADLEKVLEIPKTWPRDPIPRKTRQIIIERCEHTCQYCGDHGNATHGLDGKPWHIDHIEPWSLGGSNDESNLTLACATCNVKKRTRPAEQFAS